MEDLIRRSDAIKAIAHLHKLDDENEIRKAYELDPHSSTTDFEELLVDAFGSIRCIPAVEPRDLYDCDEWCKDCKEYDTEKHNCPRWNRVIRNTVEENKVVNCCGCIHWIDGKCEKLKIPTEDFFFCGWGERGADNEHEMF